ncbi:hypothetical protein Neosp_009073 [[Neocosmospora] mangrovei]
MRYPSAFTPVEGEADSDRCPPPAVPDPDPDPDQNNFFVNIGALDPDWIFSSFDPCFQLDTLDLPIDYELLGMTNSAGAFTPGNQHTPGNAQEPVAKYNTNEGPQQDGWLLDATEMTDTQSLKIPHLGGTKDNASQLGLHFRVPRVDESYRTSIMKSAEIALERPLWKAVSLANFPSKAKLDTCIDLFFVNFRPPVSFIHQPTFNPINVPEVVLLAIVAIGARFSNMAGAASFANSITGINRRILLLMAEQDPRVTRSEHYLTAQLLQAIGGRASGHRRLFNHSRDLRSMLVQNARQAGLFQEPTSRCVSVDDNDNDGSPESRWLGWVAAERRRRLGWAIYDLDATASILHNERPTFSMGDMVLSLPDEAARWEAPTAYSWMALHPWHPPQEERLDFRRMARGCFELSVAQDMQLTDDQHLHIVTITLARFLWSIKELQASPLMDAVPEQWPLVAHKRTLLEKLDQFRACPDVGKAVKNDGNLRRIVQRSLTIHLCHLYGAGDLMDWLPALLRTVGQHKEAKARMSRWGSEDDARLRDVAYHSAQILALSRSFPFNTPSESFYVFYAGAALWCTAVLLESSDISRTETLNNDDNGDDEDDDYEDLPTLCLDETKPENKDMDEKIQRWICQGGTLRLRVYGVPNLGSKESRIQVLQETLDILHKMRTWELSKAFSGVMQQLLLAESKG